MSQFYASIFLPILTCFFLFRRRNNDVETSEPLTVRGSLDWNTVIIFAFLMVGFLSNFLSLIIPDWMFQTVESPDQTDSEPYFPIAASCFVYISIAFSIPLLILFFLLIRKTREIDYCLALRKYYLVFSSVVFIEFVLILISIFLFTTEIKNFKGGSGYFWLGWSYLSLISACSYFIAFFLLVTFSFVYCKNF
ncbi:hypothetical protein CRE_13053 [Caenorhabditis remanei]|uniref:Uncharacterized protein n=1 Tax=Caenorhabditis remanei TaxID=31234 RepID=E3N7B8_CAERE|nr:hypothetical protein CRE_13053 [Caenorhabditis remanei]